MKTSAGVAPTKLASVLRLHALLRKSVLDRGFYQRIGDNILGSPSTIDANLYFVCYLALLASSVLKNKPRILAFSNRQRERFLIWVRHTFPNLAAFLMSLLGAEKFNTTLSRTPSLVAIGQTRTSPTVKSTADRLSAVSSYISDVRIFSRLLDFLKYVPWVLETQDAILDPNHSRSFLDRSVDHVQSTTCFVLDALETVGWITDHDWIATRDNLWWCEFSYVWSSRVWGIYLGAVIFALCRETPSSKRDRAWRVKVFEQLVQIPLVMHWSLYEGCLSSFWVGVCGVGASYWRFKETWRPVLKSE